MSGRDDHNHNDSAEESVNRRIDELQALAESSSPPVGSRAFNVTDRRLMSVARAGLFAANWVPVGGGPPETGTVIHLEGGPSGDPQIIKGFMNFRDPSVRGAIRPPHWNCERKWLSIWMDQATLPLVLRQLDHKQRVFWIGWFDNGHIFAELYAHD